MSATVIQDSCGDPAPILEIEKLKTLVHNLESQNSALRAKGFAGPAAASVHSSVGNSAGALVAEKYASPRLPDGVGALSLLDAIPLLDVDGDTSLDEESSWLYVSPSKYTAACSSSSPYKWMRQDFDEPSANTRLARRSLVFTLDDVINDLSVSKATNSSAVPASAVVSSERFATAMVGTNRELCGRGTFRANSPATTSAEVVHVATTSSRVGSRSERSPTAASSAAADAAADYPSREEAVVAAADRANGGRSAEMLDIQAMARRQEQSLRESFNSLRRASGSSSGSIPQLNLSDLDSSSGSSMSGSARLQEGNVLRGSLDTYRVDKGSGTVPLQQQQPAANSSSRLAPPATPQPVGQPTHPDSGSGRPGAAALAPPSSSVRKGCLPVPTLRMPGALTATSSSAAAVPPSERSRDPSPLPQPASLSPASSPRSALPQPSALPRVSNLPTFGSRRSGVPTPRSATSSIARPSD